MAIAHTEAIKVVDASEVDFSTGVVAYETNARGVKRFAFQVNFAGYTGVTVKIRASLDGVTFGDVTDFEITSDGDLVAGDFGPFAKYQVFVTATLSGGADTLEVWVAHEVAPR